MQKHVPYNTGKVLIGAHYIPPRNDMDTRETEFWQGVLLGDYAQRKRERMHAGVAAAVGLGFVLLCMVWL